MYSSFRDFSSSIRALFWFSSTATRFSRHLIYSFFLFRHSLAASLFFNKRISLFLDASSGPWWVPEDNNPIPLVPGTLARLTDPPLLELPGATAAEPTVTTCCAVPGKNIVCPFCVVAAYWSTPEDPAPPPPTFMVCIPSALKCEQFKSRVQLIAWNFILWYKKSILRIQ